MSPDGGNPQAILQRPRNQKGVDITATEEALVRNDAKQDEDGRGLRCRYCGCHHFFVIYTRRAQGERLIRRRECRHCGARITTFERMIREKM